MGRISRIARKFPRWRMPLPSRPRAIVVIAVMGMLAVGFALLNSALFDIRTVRVEGAQTVSPAAVAQLTGLQGEHVLMADLEAARQRILTLPMVRGATVERDWPNAVSVVIVERRPWGRWQANQTVWAIDAEGVILEGVAPPADGPVVRQTSALPPVRAGQRVDATAVSLVAELDQRGAPFSMPGIVAYEWSQQRGLAVITQHGEIVFGDAQGLDFKYQVWRQLEAEAQRRGEPLLMADLRYGLRPRVEIGFGLGREVRQQGTQ